MKPRLLILLALVFIFFVLAGILIQRTWFCNQFSGTHFYFGGGSQQCEENNCRVFKLKEFDNPNAMDDEGYYFRCVPKLF